MKKQHQPHQHHGNSSNTHPQLVPVRFEFSHPTAVSVHVAGTFNEWRAGAIALLPTGGGDWVRETSLAPGNYEYRLIVDGQWMADPAVAESVPNQFGGQNSVLRVPRTPAAAHLEEATNRPLDNATK